MEHKNILSYIAKDIQKQCERLGIYAEFTPKNEKHIVSSDFKMQPAIFKSIHVEADITYNQDKIGIEGEDDIMYISVSLRLIYTYWEGGENGHHIGWTMYDTQLANFNRDLVYLDGCKSLCTVKKTKGIEL